MKKITLLMAFLSTMVCAVAQVNYYENTKRFEENGYTYQCDVDEYDFVRLYNVENKWTYVDMMKKGENVPFYHDKDAVYEPMLEERRDIDGFRKTYALFREIVNKAFGSYCGKMQKIDLLIMTCTNSDTGVIDEVYFDFSKHSPYATVPVSVYREIEAKIVGYKRTPTALGRSVNYIFEFWVIEPK